MFFSDPFANGDPGEGGGRARARLACRLVCGLAAGGTWLGMHYAPTATEPFALLGIGLMLGSLLLSYVL
jgi:hypothetical protein